MIPAQAQIERDAAGNLECVLHEDAEFAIRLLAADQWIEARTGKGSSEKKVGVAESAVGAVEIEAAVAAIGNQTAK